VNFEQKELGLLTGLSSGPALFTDYILHPDRWNKWKRNWACWRNCPRGLHCLL